MRAYTMLKNDGVLVAIISTRWNTIDDDISKDFKEFIDTISAKFEHKDLLIEDWAGSKTYGEDEDANISKISNLKISMIKITKTGDDTDYCNLILLEQVHLFNDDIYDKAIKLMEETNDLNIVVEEEEEIENNNIQVNNKELIQNTINKHNDSNTKKKEIKTDDTKINNTYNKKNHLTTNKRRGGLDTNDDIAYRKELTKIDEYDRTISNNRRHEDIRLYDDFF